MFLCYLGEVNNNSETVFDIGDFVIVNYLDDYYPGRVTGLKDGMITVSAMIKAGMNKWKWPKNKDEIEYQYDQIIRKIKTPVEVNKRGFFLVEELEEK